MSSVTVAAEGFRRALNQVLRAASTDPKAGVLRGVCVEAHDAVLRLVATDKHRLVVSELPILNGADAEFSVVLEATLLAELPHAGADAEVVLTIHPQRALMSVGGHPVEVAVLGGDFPDHRGVLNQVTGDARDAQLVADQTAVLDALEELPDDEPLRVRLRPNALELGQLVPIAVDATYGRADLSLLVEPTYLHDAVDAAAGPLVAIEAVDERSPVVVRTPGDNSYVAVVMPILVGTPRQRKG